MTTNLSRRVGGFNPPWNCKVNCDDSVSYLFMYVDVYLHSNIITLEH